VRTTPETFVDLVASHRREILAYLVRLLGHEQDAQDVCQDVLLRACRAFDRLPRDANARAWLYRIATNRALTALARRRRRRTHQIEVDLDGLAAADSAVPERREQLRAVARAIEHLPGRQRAALVQRRLQGLSYEEIAAILGGTAEAARANVYQAVRKLRVLLDDSRTRR
jgi:RNA polymerase sigma factor (sigma-70 family)